MKTQALACATALLLSLPAAALAQDAMSSGEVKKIDDAAGKITLKHGPIRKLDMDEGMTMVFRVKDQAMLKAVKVGDKVRFGADRIDGQFVVTTIQKSK